MYLAFSMALQEKGFKRQMGAKYSQKNIYSGMKISRENECETNLQLIIHGVPLVPPEILRLKSKEWAWKMRMKCGVASKKAKFHFEHIHWLL